MHGIESVLVKRVLIFGSPRIRSTLSLEANYISIVCAFCRLEDVIKTPMLRHQWHIRQVGAHLFVLIFFGSNT